MGKPLTDTQYKILCMALGLGGVLVTDLPFIDFVFIGGIYPGGTEEVVKLYRGDWQKLSRHFDLIQDHPPLRWYSLKTIAGEFNPNLTKVKGEPRDVPEWKCDYSWHYKGVDGDVAIFRCADHWRIAWETGNTVIIAALPQHCRYALVVNYKFKDSDDLVGTRTLETNPWKTLRSLMRWLADLPSIRVEYLPATEDDEQGVRDAWKMIATRILAQEGQSSNE
ncbi:MAG TPA: hypothetical protein VF590_04225 [Isosphaeraceae bacterium]|jgi:hypothetical protein